MILGRIGVLDQEGKGGEGRGDRGKDMKHRDIDRFALHGENV